ncbi:MAG: hypothetical protein ACNA8W_10480 [Bradymonadaceae bacterium]
MKPYPSTEEMGVRMGVPPRQMHTWALYGVQPPGWAAIFREHCENGTVFEVRAATGQEVKALAAALGSWQALAKEFGKHPVAVCRYGRFGAPIRGGMGPHWLSQQAHLPDFDGGGQ